MLERMRIPASRWWVVSSVLAALLVGVVVAWRAYETVPTVRFHLQESWTRLYRRYVPRSELAPTPVQAASAPQLVTYTPRPRLTLTVVLSPVVSPTLPPPTPTMTPVPARVVLEGFRHEYQKYNNCGPAALAINLSYWGWGGSQKDTAAVLKPNPDDKNVSPRELYEYLLSINFDAYIRYNGDIETLKRFVAAGYPVLIEKGFTCVAGERCSGWFGHYSVVSGYDEARQEVYLQDSYRGPNITMSYAELLTNWRAFNYLYLVVFPASAERDAEVVHLLGAASDLTQNYSAALARAQAEALTLGGQEAAFAWFNVGTNLAYLQDYAGAAAAYDQARQIGLPYRMLWYQFGPYRAYYYMARYDEVVALATDAINGVAPGVVAGLEEAYYWRGQAEEMLGQREAAIADYRTALQRHPGYAPAEAALQALGVTE